MRLTGFIAAAALVSCAAGKNRNESGSTSSGHAGSGGATTTSGAGGDAISVGVGGSTGSGEPLPYEVCDDGIALDDPDPWNAARAIELCNVSTNGEPGVIDAKYVRGDGSPATAPLQYGIMSSFGPNVLPEGGARMLVLSTGRARADGDPDKCGTIMCSEAGQGVPPPGYPTTKPGCESGFPPEQGNLIYDDVGLELRLRAPMDATGYQIAFKFYSFEYPEFVCSPYNDQFVTLVDPPPQGAVDGNISFDTAGNPIGVNLALFEACDPAASSRFALYCYNAMINMCPPVPNPYCPSGMPELMGTGFDSTWYAAPWIGNEDGGATVWLKSTAPIVGGEEFSIRFAIWDKADAIYDATVIVDRFEWLGKGRVDVETEPIY